MCECVCEREREWDQPSNRDPNYCYCYFALPFFALIAFIAFAALFGYYYGVNKDNIAGEAGAGRRVWYQKCVLGNGRCRLLRNVIWREGRIKCREK